MRQRRAERGARKAETARQRLAQRMDALGRDWRVLDLKESSESERATFLAVGPGGVFAVTVKDHGRSRISFAGDVVQVDGMRPRYVAEARKNAQVAADALSRKAGVSIPVMPVLAFAGSGTIVFYGMPKGCLVTSYQDLHRVLKARGRRLAPTTVEKVFAVASHPRTWVNEPYVALADRYRWYSDDGQVGADKKATPR
ncbi:MAG: hypothetical protein HKP61_01480 [Dactylosporangium sp.]|nr:hypothetical protein [Dactylosporangium sp.]NNJ59636.1 hypothetical protein [Dactylosporangium sp.]